MHDDFCLYDEPNDEARMDRYQNEPEPDPQPDFQDIQALINEVVADLNQMCEAILEESAYLLGISDQDDEPPPF